jgi:hypothetical protein
LQFEVRATISGLGATGDGANVTGGLIVGLAFVFDGFQFGAKFAALRGAAYGNGTDTGLSVSVELLVTRVVDEDMADPVDRCQLCR